MNKDTIEFKRILTKDSRLVVQAGQVFLGEYALTHQRFTNVEDFRNEKTISDSLEASFGNQGLVTKLSTQKDVMFIQIIPDSTMGTFDALRFLNFRQDIDYIKMSVNYTLILPKFINFLLAEKHP